MRQTFLTEFCPQLRRLVAGLLACDGGYEVVDCFRRHTFTWLSADDVAGHCQCPLDRVQHALNQLDALGILQRRPILDWTFYSLTTDTQILNALEQFWLIHDAWSRQWALQRETLQLQTGAAQAVPANAPFCL